MTLILPQFALDSTGNTRRLYVRDPLANANVPLGVVAQGGLIPLDTASVTPLLFGARGDGVTDDTAPLQAFFAMLGAGFLGSGAGKTYAFSAPLAAAKDLIRLSELHLHYIGANTAPGNLVSFGDPSLLTRHQELHVERLRVSSASTLTNGFAVASNYMFRAHLDVLLDDVNLYQGLTIPSNTLVYLGESYIATRNKCVEWTNGVELHCQSAFVSGPNADGTGIGIHLGGGCGGLYTENLTQLLNDIGLKVDTSITGTGNTQIFTTSSTFDTNTTANLYFDDAISNEIGKRLHMNGWASSNRTTTSGIGLWIKNFRDATVSIAAGADFSNCSQYGVYLEDASCDVDIAPGAVIQDNYQYGVHSSVAMTISCQALMRHNGYNPPSGQPGGDIGPLLTLRTSVQGTHVPQLQPAKGWLADVSSLVLTVAQGASVMIPAGSGMFLVADNPDGDTGAYMIGGTGVLFLGSTTSATWTVPTTTPASGKASVDWNGTGYSIFNNTGVTKTFVVALVFQTRTQV